MSKSEIMNEVTRIFKDVFDDDELVISESTSAENIEDWDSLGQINLLIAMEKKFTIKFDIREVTSIQNVGDMINLIERKIS